MARAVGVSQGLISKVVNEHQAPGRRLTEALAAHPGINPEWVATGTGEPTLRPDRGSLPVTEEVLPGPPQEYPHLLTGSRHPVAGALDRPSRYWVRLSPDSPLVLEPTLRLAPDDLLLLETDANWTRRPDLTEGRLCGVRFPVQPVPVYHLGRVLEASGGLTAKLFGGSFVPPQAPPPPPATPTPERASTETTPGRRVRRRVRRLEDQEQKRRLREEREAQARTKARDGLQISRDDIVAVQVYMARPELFFA
jgi:hypothetical protein